MMFKIIKLKIEISTDGGRFGNIIEFNSNLNIIHGDNSTGKSTCVNVILYALGLEELLGGKKEKTMKPVLRDELEYLDQTFKVLESNVYLEIENDKKTIITVKRSIKSENRDSNLISVIFGGIITNPDENYKVQDMYVVRSHSTCRMNGQWH